MDQRIAGIEEQAARGRLAVYLTTPPLSSFSSPTLAGDAARILAQSQTARASILTARGPDPNQGVESVDVRRLIAQAPQVVPLNGRDAALICGGSVRPDPPPPPPEMLMPQPAPVARRVGRPATPGAPAPVVYINPDPVPDSWLAPAGGLQMTSGPTQYMGYSGFGGYAPPWGDAGLVMAESTSDGSAGSGWLKGLLVLGGLVILGGAVGGVSKRAKRRFGKR